ncbi:MAG: mandelate racemase/muconate lactonizing enzyme family protein [Armatimonadetes bacterium]|nr:mandelate racemase/muconate lactonizing enzyme family protein [Armatimonadota bacterium]
MKITRITTAVVEANYDYTFIRVEADRDGLYGTGESFFAPGLTAILHEMIPLLLGKDPREIDRLARHLARKASGAGSTAGIVWNAISGIEAALHDLVGKHYGCPVYQLLGGKLRDEVRIYADCHAGGNVESWTPMLVPREPKWLQPLGSSFEQPGNYEPEAYSRRAREVVAKGFTALKFDLDSIVLLTGEEMHRPLNNVEIDRMVEVVRVTREAVGPAIDLAFDCHWRFRPSDAIKIGRAIEPFNVFWLEDPCPPDNWRQTAAVKRACGVPLLTGENLVQCHAFQPLLESQAVDLVAPDVQKCGGLLEARRIADLANLYGIGLAPHCIASPLGLMASAHVCAASANFTALEFHGQDVPFWDDLIAGDPLLQEGRVTMTDRPGFGVELNEEVAREYAKPGEGWFR